MQRIMQSIPTLEWYSHNNQATKYVKIKLNTCPTKINEIPTANVRSVFLALQAVAVAIAAEVPHTDVAAEIVIIIVFCCFFNNNKHLGDYIKITSSWLLYNMYIFLFMFLVVLPVSGITSLYNYFHMRAIALSAYVPTLSIPVTFHQN